LGRPAVAQNVHNCGIGLPLPRDLAERGLEPYFPVRSRISVPLGRMGCRRPQSTFLAVCRSQVRFCKL
jgi:hypothetical protein